MNRTKVMLPIALTAGLFAISGTALYKSRPNVTVQDDKSRSPVAAREYIGDCEVIFQKNVHLPNKLYIIAQTHDNPLPNIPGWERYTKTREFLSQDKLDRAETARIQRQIYRTLTDLVDHRGLELILMEGAFYDQDYSNMMKQERELIYKSFKGDQAAMKWCLQDNKTVEEMIIDSPTLNASDLLNLTHNVDFQGADSPGCHSLFEQACNPELIKAYPIKANAIMDYATEMRSGLILIGAPGTAFEERQKGHVKKLDTAIVIGSAHIKDMIDYVINEQVKVPARETIKEYSSPLPLSKWGYGVIVLKPTLIDLSTKH